MKMGRAKNRWLWMVFIALLVLSAGCSLPGVGGNDTDQEKPDITGLIYTIENGRILVVAGIDSIGIACEEWFEAGEMAIIFNILEDTQLLGIDGQEIVYADLEEGQKVQAWIDEILLESYPAQADAKRVVVVEEAERPDNGIDEINGLDGEDGRPGEDESRREAVVSLLQGMSSKRETGFRTKTRVLQVEDGEGKEEMVFRLLNLPSLPFSTYIPGEPDRSPYFLLGHGHLWGQYGDLPPGQEIVMIARSDEGHYQVLRNFGYKY